MNTPTAPVSLFRALRLGLPGLTTCLLVGALHAQTTPVEPVVIPPDVVGLDSADPKQVETRLSASFETLAGSEENARNLVNGLRTGSEITLTTEVDGQSVVRTFEPAAGEQGYGNVFLALSLAEHELAKAGVDEPTAAQLEAALNGGVIAVGSGEAAKSVPLAGVLSLRAEGRGWGQIAREMDVNLGQIVGGLRRNPRAGENLALRPTAAERAVRPERIERIQKVDRIERVERAARVERPVPVQRVERPVRPERPERPGRP